MVPLYAAHVEDLGPEDFVEVAVREAAGLTHEDIGAAFNAETGPLTDMEPPEAVRRARAALFSGAIGSYKNTLIPTGMSIWTIPTKPPRSSCSPITS